VAFKAAGEIILPIEIISVDSREELRSLFLTNMKRLPEITVTQQFIEITNIVDDIVILNGGNAALVIEVSATNFTLLSPEEQDAKIYAYASLLNSLSFPIQIVIRSKNSTSPITLSF